MTTANSSRRARGAKPAKPHKDFPLTAHRNGQWCKKIKGRLWYFGTWDDPDGAVQQYLDEKDDIGHLVKQGLGGEGFRQGVEQGYQQGVVSHF